MVKLSFFSKRKAHVPTDFFCYQQLTRQPNPAQKDAHGPSPLQKNLPRSTVQGRSHLLLPTKHGYSNSHRKSFLNGMCFFQFIYSFNLSIWAKIIKSEKIEVFGTECIYIVLPQTLSLLLHFLCFCKGHKSCTAYQKCSLHSLSEKKVFVQPQTQTADGNKNMKHNVTKKQKRLGQSSIYGETKALMRVKHCCCCCFVDLRPR